MAQENLGEAEPATRRVRPLALIRAEDGPSVGSKAANLGELAARGFPVPAGFAVSADACREQFARLDVAGEVAGLEGAATRDLAPRCALLQRRIVEAELPRPLADAILAAHARLIGGDGSRGDVRCAVRSSATAEDLAGASFAGQHGTYYYVDRAHLLEMVRHCWASLWSPEAVAYRTSHGVPHASVFMAVVVQAMVPSEVSGVAFTAHPVTGDRGEIVVESSWGMGAAIVDGRVTPDRYLVERAGLTVRERRIADKRFMVLPEVEEGRAERLVAVPHDKRRSETLSADQVRLVAEWSVKCEEHFGCPQDTEWAIEGGRFHLLQSRPITTLRRPGVELGVKGKHVLFKPLAENFSEPLTPLSVDILSCVVPPGLSIIAGRAYINLTYVKPLLPFAMSDEETAALLYDFGAPRAAPRFSPLKLPAALLAGALGYLVLAVVLARTRGMPDGFMDGYRRLCRKVEADPKRDPLQVFRRLWLLPGLFDPVGNMALLVNGCSMRFLPWMFVLQRMLRRWAPSLGPDALTVLCAGTDGVLSAEMGRGIRALSQEAGRHAPVREILERHEPEEALARLRTEPAARGFVEQLDGFLAVHGHRGIREFELRSPRWEENPAPVLGMIRNSLLAGPAVAPPDERVGRARIELEEQIHRTLRARPGERLLGLRRWLIRLAAGRARYYLKLRENSRFYHVMGLGAVRRKILGIEAELRRGGALKCKDDVFFLLLSEIAGLRSGRLAWRDVEERIRERRIEHVRLSKTTPPRTIGIEMRPEDAGDGSGPGDRLHGQPASPGRYQGVARVVLDPSADLALRPGDVLIAPYTDPAWTPLFLTAGAAVVEVGSYLSHAGTVAREFGMPCVVDVADCTRLIQTGERVDVDGSRGVVQLLRGTGEA